MSSRERYDDGQSFVKVESRLKKSQKKNKKKTKKAQVNPKSQLEPAVTNSHEPLII